MSTKTIHADRRDIKHTVKVYRYPGDIVDIVASDAPVFGSSGWEASEDWSRPRRAMAKPEQSDGEGEAAGEPKPARQRDTPEAIAEDVARSMRRARAKVRRLALANEFRWFVTLTLDPSKVDTIDGAAVVKKLNAWASNAVQRQGLKYILVPERHKKGGIHFHGFFNDALPAVDSGTIRLPWAKKPRRPRSEAQRAEWLAQGGRIVYNLPGWSLGFTTAMGLYGEYPAAVAYVWKYIGKDGEKPAGRWYYSGGALAQPKEEYADLTVAEVEGFFEGKCYSFTAGGRKIAVVNGVKIEEVEICTDT